MYQWRLSEHEWTACCNCTFIFLTSYYSINCSSRVTFHIFFSQRMLMFLFFFYYLFAIFIYKYVAFIEKTFQVISEKQKTRLFPDESGQFFIHLNSSLIPHKDKVIEQFECVLKYPFHLLTIHLPIFDK